MLELFIRSAPTSGGALLALLRLVARGYHPKLRYAATPRKYEVRRPQPAAGNQTQVTTTTATYRPPPCCVTTCRAHAACHVCSVCTPITCYVRPPCCVCSAPQQQYVCCTHTTYALALTFHGHNEEHIFDRRIFRHDVAAET